MQTHTTTIIWTHLYKPIKFSMTQCSTWTLCCTGADGNISVLSATCASMSINFQVSVTGMSVTYKYATANYISILHIPIICQHHLKLINTKNQNFQHSVIYEKSFSWRGNNVTTAMSKNMACTRACTYACTYARMHARTHTHLMASFPG